MATQHLSCKAQSMLDVFKAKTTRFANKYQAALQSLNPDSEWTHWLHKLDQKDLHFPRQEEDIWGKRRRDQSENQRQLSWIWLVVRSNVDVESDRAIMADEISDGEFYNIAGGPCY